MIKKLLLLAVFITATFSYAQVNHGFEASETVYPLTGTAGGGTAAVETNTLLNGVNSTASEVLKIVEPAGSAFWAGTRIGDAMSQPYFGIGATHGHYVSFKFTSTRTDGSINLKLANGKEKTYVYTGITVNTWYNAEFDFSSEADFTSDQLTILFDVYVVGGPYDSTGWFTAGTEAEHTFYIDDIVQSTASVLSNEDVALRGINVYPNPTSGLVNISDTSNVNEISITNIVGQTIKTFGSQSTIDISDLPSGVYFLTTDNGLKRKIVKQ